jgi:hypothetical protein
MDKLWDREEIISFLRDLAQTERPDLNWDPTTPQSDLFIGLFGSALYRLTLILQYVKSLCSLNSLEELLNDESLLQEIADALQITRSELDDLLKYDIEALSELYGISIQNGKKARTMLRIYFSVASTSWTIEDLWFYTSSGLRFHPVNVGNTVESIEPVDTEEQQTDLSAVQKVPNLSYEFIEIMVEAEQAGSEYNVPAGSITAVEGNIPNMIAITNPWDVRNGRDAESLVNYVRRLRNYAAYGKFSLTWIENLLRENYAFDDIKIYTIGDSNFARPFGADIWVIPEEFYGTVVQEVDDTSLVVHGLEHFAKPPVACDNATLNVQEYSDSPFYARSVLADDYLQFSSVPHDAQAYLTVDLSVQGAQNMLHNLENWMIGAEYALLIRVAKKVLLQFDIELVILSGYDADTVKGNVQSAVDQYVATLGIGDDIQASEVISVIQNVDGVDYVELSSFLMTRIDTSQSSPDVLSPEFYEYFRFGSITWL